MKWDFVSWKFLFYKSKMHEMNGSSSLFLAMFFRTLTLVNFKNHRRNPRLDHRFFVRDEQTRPFWKEANQPKTRLLFFVFPPTRNYQSQVSTVVAWWWVSGFHLRGVSLLGLLAQILEAKELEKSKNLTRKTSVQLEFGLGIGNPPKAPPKNNSGDGGLLKCLMILFEHLQLTTHHPIGICEKTKLQLEFKDCGLGGDLFASTHRRRPPKILHSATMLCITSAFSGDVIAELCALQLHGSSAVEVKQAVAAECGVPRFRQRLFLEDGSELEGDNLKLEAQTLELVILNFGPPDEEEDQELIEACRNEYETEVERLLMLPRNPNVRDQSWFLPNGPTPLHLASQMGNLRLVRLLLEAGADPDAVAHGATALFVAAANDKLEVARLLIHAGADPDLPGTDTFHGVVLSCGLFFDFPLWDSTGKK